LAVGESGSSAGVTPPTAGVFAATTVPVGMPRVLLVGDSTLLAVRSYDVLDVFRGFDGDYEAASCRTLGVPSCGDEPVPPNAVETIAAAEGDYDAVVIMAGYDEWWTSFPTSFDDVVAAARAKGAEHIVWLTYREGVGYTAPDGATANEAFVRNNATVREKVASGSHPDVTIADWFRYTADSTTWLTRDGIHLSPQGARAVADYISRYIAFLYALPCPAPWVAGATVEPVCSNPDDHGPVADIDSLYPDS
jgi:hypothetical protein